MRFFSDKKETAEEKTAGAAVSGAGAERTASEGTIAGAGAERTASEGTVAGAGRGETGTAAAAAEARPGWKGLLLYFSVYTVLFCAMAAAVFVWFWLRRRRFIWQTDGVNQHYYGLLYFSRWGKEVIRQFRETGVLRLPTFSLRIGYGEDLFTTLAYYVIGDPFCLPAVFVPEKYMMHFHDIMLMARFWLAGVSFSAYSFYTRRRSYIGVLAGTMVYIFNGFTLSGMRHHYFINPFIFFPLLLIGAERIFRKKKPGLFIFMVFLTAVSNFYFFYMMVLMTVLYAVWRSVRINGLRRFGRVLLDGISFLWYGVLGVLLSAVVFLPVVLRFLQDPRAGETKEIALLWPLKYYQNFIDSFLTNSSASLAESWTYMGFGAAAAFCVLFIFTQRKKHFDLKAAFIGLTALLLTPAAGYVLNGFSYPANRWMWAYALLIGTMTAAAVPELAEAGVRQFLAALLLLAAAVAACIGWHYSFSRESAQAVVIVLFGIAAVLLCRLALLERERGIPAGETRLLPGERRKYVRRIEASFLACVLATIVMAGYFNYAPSRASKVFEYLSRAQIDLKITRDGAAAAELLDGRGMSTDGYLRSAGTGDGYAGDIPFYRYTTFDPENNTSILYGVSNTQYYWSLSNPDISQFLTETGQLNRMIHQYDTLDDRTALNEIAGVRFFLSDTENGVPFGYEKVEGLSYNNDDVWPENDHEERYRCEVYENQYVLPLGFTSGTWISREDYEALDIAQRQQALMQGILLEQDPGEGLTKLSPESTDGTAAAETTSAESTPAESTRAESADSAAATGVPGAAGSGENTAAAVQSAEAGNTAQLTFSDIRVPVEVEVDESLFVEADLPKEDGGPIRLTADEGAREITFRFAGLPDCETMLYIRGLHYDPPEGTQGPSKVMISAEGFSGETLQASKQIGYTTERDPWTTGRTDFLVNMRYREQAMDSITLTFPSSGTYTFDSVEVVCQPMTDYPAQALELGREVMTDLDIHEMGGSGAMDTITGRITVDEPRILCLQIPRTAGWTAYVDGVRTELLQADTMFSALLLTAGTHEIELRYQTPGLRLGAVVSAGTLFLLLLFSIVYAIVSAILTARERRLEAIPDGAYETVSEDGVSEAGTDREGYSDPGDRAPVAEKTREKSPAAAERPTAEDSRGAERAPSGNISGEDMPEEGTRPWS